MQVLTKAFSTVLIAFFFVRCNGSLIEKATAPTTDRELAPLKLSICDAVDNLCKTLGENHSHCKLTRNAECAASCSAPLAKAVTKPEDSENGIDVGETGRNQQLSSYGAGPVITLVESGTAGNHFGIQYTETQTPTIEDCAEKCLLEGSTCGGITYGTQNGDSTEAGVSDGVRANDCVLVRNTARQGNSKRWSVYSVLAAAVPTTSPTAPTASPTAIPTASPTSIPPPPPVWGSLQPIYIHKQTGIKCSNSSNHDSNATLGKTKKECAALAEASEHNFFSHDAASSACITSPSCVARAEAPGWIAYKKMRGAYNSTHVDETPANDGNNGGNGPSNGLGGRRLHECLTQTTVFDEQTGKNETRGITCTSCSNVATPGHKVQCPCAFSMYYPKSRAGECWAYPKLAGQAPPRCQTLNSDEGAAGPQQTSFICTKVQTTTSIMFMSTLDTATQDYLTSLGIVNMQRIVPVCHIRKEVICEGTDCTTQKEIKCHRIGKLKGWDGNSKPLFFGNLPNEVEACNSDFGRAVCKFPASFE